MVRCNAHKKLRSDKTHIRRFIYIYIYYVDMYLKIYGAKSSMRDRFYRCICADVVVVVLGLLLLSYFAGGIIN